MVVNPGFKTMQYNVRSNQLWLTGVALFLCEWFSIVVTRHGSERVKMTSLPPLRTENQMTLLHQLVVLDLTWNESLHVYASFIHQVCPFYLI